VAKLAHRVLIGVAVASAVFTIVLAWYLFVGLDPDRFVGTWQRLSSGRPEPGIYVVIEKSGSRYVAIFRDLNRGEQQTSVATPRDNQMRVHLTMSIDVLQGIRHTITLYFVIDHGRLQAMLPHGTGGPGDMVLWTYERVGSMSATASSPPGGGP